ncbi:MAG: hypothetical protein KKB70_08230 [Proteobacteria bacterium]|nr:hypothetical protein [Pseudomonadota bacterium]MBU1611289.1 hypothetical protein [Pseudomonadota bacterium]
MLPLAPLGTRGPEKLQRSFKKSPLTCFALDNGRIHLERMRAGGYAE